MKITATCSCGASVVIESGVYTMPAQIQFEQWRKDHEAHGKADAPRESVMCGACGGLLHPDCGNRKNAIDMREPIPCRPAWTHNPGAAG